MGDCDVGEAKGGQGCVTVVLLRDMKGMAAAEKLALFGKLKARGGFAGEDRAELLNVERMLRTFAATKK
jgi:hypothetical protein